MAKPTSPKPSKTDTDTNKNMQPTDANEDGEALGAKEVNDPIDLIAERVQEYYVSRTTKKADEGDILRDIEKLWATNPQALLPPNTQDHTSYETALKTWIYWRINTARWTSHLYYFHPPVRKALEQRASIRRAFAELEDGFENLKVPIPGGNPEMDAENVVTIMLGRLLGLDANNAENDREMYMLEEGIKMMRGLRRW
ncbi:hypothetical protein CC80DRAFT_489623 [Byssothecium circinans]|uniref:Uncharacterized protein n=1 Tax=Byssothecium circinans TaxID=147558 RepID=A0A6A5U6L2_9PLEO|nr:hypothetical protein CC80DRAFT_489623 [Byssothecium circinans]